MEFQEYSEERRLATKECEHKVHRLNDLAYVYLDEIFSCDAVAYAGFRHVEFERGERYEMRLTVHETVAVATFEHVRLADTYGGRWTFWRSVRDGKGGSAQIPIFAIEFDEHARLRYGTRGDWSAEISRNPREPWKARERLMANVVSAIQDGLAHARP